MISLTRLFGLTAVVLGLISGTRSEGAFATYTESALATGSLNGVTFSNALVTLTQTGDTVNIVKVQDTRMTTFKLADVTSTFTVAGIGSGSFTGPTTTYVSPERPFADTPFGGVADGIPSFSNTIFLFIESETFSTYDLATSIGPVTGPSSGEGTFATSAGDLNLRFAGTGTFQAVVTTSAVPEPSSLALCGIAGLTGLGFAGRRRKRAATA